jgi:cell division septation protein DedD
MKMHTFFLSGKAIAIVSGAFGACGMLLFVSGVLVGVRVQVDGAARGPVVASRSAAAADAKPVAQPAGPMAAPSVAAPAQSAPAASPGATGSATTSPAATPATIGATADAGDASAASASWPFTSSAFAPSTFASPQSAPVETQPAPLPVTAAPVAPAAPSPARRATMGDVSMIAYVPPSSQAAADIASSARSVPEPAPRDRAEYLVQVGIFRVEQHAKDLVDRLNAAGYRATITERQEGDRALHVVRVGRFTGLETAEKVAARIGGSEQLVASVVAAPR